MSETLILYTTVGCHLCDEAVDVITQACPERLAVLNKVDIMDDDALFERYRYSIPVLKDPQGNELNWPFNTDQLREFLA